MPNEAPGQAPPGAPGEEATAPGAYIMPVFNLCVHELLFCDATHLPQIEPLIEM